MFSYDFETSTKSISIVSDKMKNFPESMRPIPKPIVMKPDQEYYNDMPQKIPPEISNTKTNKSPIFEEKRRERISSNLIDLDTPMDHNYVNEKGNDSDDDLFAELTSSGLKVEEKNI